MVDVPLLRLMITYTVEAMPIEARAQTHHLPHMAVSINGGTPKWLVYNGKIPNKMDALGVPPVLGNLHTIFYAYPTFVGPASAKVTSAGCKFALHAPPQIWPSCPIPCGE